MTNNIALAYADRLRTLATELAMMPVETAHDASRLVNTLDTIGELYRDMFGDDAYNALESFGVGATNAELAARIIADLDA